MSEVTVNREKLVGLMLETAIDSLSLGVEEFLFAALGFFAESGIELTHEEKVDALAHVAGRQYPEAAEYLGLDTPDWAEIIDAHLRDLPKGDEVHDFSRKIDQILAAAKHLGVQVDPHGELVRQTVAACHHAQQKSGLGTLMHFYLDGWTKADVEAAAQEFPESEP